MVASTAEKPLLYPHASIRIARTKDAGGAIVTRVSTLHRDAQGSVRAVTTAAGLEAENTVHRPFGEETTTVNDIATAPETKGYIGERFDADAGLQYLNARYYDPKLGLFLQPDWWEVTQAGVGTNRYAYSGNDPINGTDASGHAAVYKDGNYIGQINPGDPGYGDDFSQSGILPSEWVRLNDNLRSLSESDTYSGIDGSGQCPNCMTDKPLFPYQDAFSFSGNVIARIYTLSSISLNSFKLAMEFYFESTIGQKVGKILASKSIVVDVFEKFPLDGRKSEKMGGMAYRGDIFASEEELGSMRVRDQTGARTLTVPLDITFAHEFGHVVSGKYLDEQFIVDEYENPYREFIGKSLRGKYGQ